MYLSLFDYQDSAAREVLKKLDTAREIYRDPKYNKRTAFALAACTGAGVELTNHETGAAQRVPATRAAMPQPHPPWISPRSYLYYRGTIGGAADTSLRLKTCRDRGQRIT